MELKKRLDTYGTLSTAFAFLSNERLLDILQHNVTSIGSSIGVTARFHKHVGPQSEHKTGPN